MVAFALILYLHKERQHLGDPFLPRPLTSEPAANFYAENVKKFFVANFALSIENCNFTMGKGSGGTYPYPIAPNPFQCQCTDFTFPFASFALKSNLVTPFSFGLDFTHFDREIWEIFRTNVQPFSMCNNATNCKL